jgi:hypothetical protein
MASFKGYYRALYRTFGFPLTKRSAMPLAEISKAEKCLDVRIPKALRDYYLVAGRERGFNRCCHRLLSPADWEIDKRRLLFMEENQKVLWWGVSVRNPETVDPPVSQGLNEEPIEWQPEVRKCSVFLALMLHYHAVGWLPHTGQANLSDSSHYRFEKHGWTKYGTLRTMTAYSRPNQVVCLTPPSDLPWAQQWSVQAGAKTKRDLDAIASDLGVTFA